MYKITYFRLSDDADLKSVVVRRFSHVMPTKFIQVMWIIFLKHQCHFVNFGRLNRTRMTLPCMPFGVHQFVRHTICPWLEMSLCNGPHILELYLHFYTHRIRVEVFIWFTWHHPTQWVSMDNNEWERASVQLNSCSWSIVKKPEIVG